MNNTLDAIDHLPAGKKLLYAVMWGMRIGGHNDSGITTDDLKALAADHSRAVKAIDAAMGAGTWDAAFVATTSLSQRLTATRSHAKP